ncbi:acyltransferase family protein [Dysgonomonas macrotermitis]|uniref:Surface polysaccharide O-acyltransferase, integral membrane enzyme n=1 Tax=Dysgonomonas macrotermitis TaxID=1346286 RepID=A0A1M5BHQ4_9BACT|nr:Surface polysaccharide O-acyltransferase, integral membrane enzyme [Dysgonomonas macrotermitis]
MKRNISLDYLKVVLSILVVLIHLKPLVKSDVYILNIISWEVTEGIARIAVPCFFILNGYFLGKKLINSILLKEHCTFLLKIYIIWILIYLSLYASLGSFETSSASIVPIIKSIIIGFEHLWYILALIEALIIIFVLEKLIPSEKTKSIIFLSLFLFCAGYWIQNKYILDIGKFASRNALFIGVPFIYLGILIRKKESILLKFKSKYLLIISLCAFFLLLLEAYFSFLKGYSVDIYISLIILSPCVILFFIKRSHYTMQYNDFIKDLAPTIFYSHGVILTLVRLFPGHVDNIFQIPIILLFTLCLSCILMKINKNIKIFF